MLWRAAAGFLAMLLAGCTSIPPVSSNVEAGPIIERERELTRALVKNKRFAVREFLAPGFTCELNMQGKVTVPLGAGAHLCTGMGHDSVSRANRPDWQIDGEQSVPRSAEIETIAVERHEGLATAVSIQRYRNWFPYDGATERRSRVTDTWLLNEGKWQLIHRLSEPLDPQTASH